MSLHGYFFVAIKPTFDFSSRISKCLLDVMTIIHSILMDNLQTVCKNKVIKESSGSRLPSQLHILPVAPTSVLPPHFTLTPSTHTHTHSHTHIHTDTSA